MHKVYPILKKNGMRYIVKIVVHGEETMTLEIRVPGIRSVTIQCDLPPRLLAISLESTLLRLDLGVNHPSGQHNPFFKVNCARFAKQTQEIHILESMTVGDGRWVMITSIESARYIYDLPALPIAMLGVDVDPKDAYGCLPQSVKLVPQLPDNMLKVIPYSQYCRIYHVR